MDSEILAPLINKNHREIKAAVNKITARIERGDLTGVHEALYGLFNSLEQYYAAHNFYVKRYYSHNCKEQIANRDKILQLLFNACLAYHKENYAKTLMHLNNLMHFLERTMHTYIEQ